MVSRPRPLMQRFMTFVTFGTPGQLFHTEPNTSSESLLVVLNPVLRLSWYLESLLQIPLVREIFTT